MLVLGPHDYQKKDWILDKNEWIDLIEQVPAFSITKYVEPIIKRKKEFYVILLEDSVEWWLRDDYDTCIEVWKASESDELEALCSSLTLCSEE